MIKKFQKTLFIILIAFFASLSIQPATILHKKNQEQRSYISFSGTAFGIPTSLLQPEEFSFKKRPESHHPFALFSILSLFFAFYFRLRAQRLFAIGIQDLSYDGQKIQILSARSHPPTLFSKWTSCVISFA